jgi:hypothetical protein
MGKGAVMMRLAALLTSAIALAACSSSSRVDGIVPAWANTPAHSGTSPAATKRAGARSGSEIETQGAARPGPLGEE